MWNTAYCGIKHAVELKHAVESTTRLNFYSKCCGAGAEEQSERSEHEIRSDSLKHLEFVADERSPRSEKSKRSELEIRPDSQHLACLRLAIIAFMSDRRHYAKDVMSSALHVSKLSVSHRGTMKQL